MEWLGSVFAGWLEMRERLMVLRFKRNDVSSGPVLYPHQSPGGGVEVCSTTVLEFWRRNSFMSLWVFCAGCSRNMGYWLLFMNGRSKMGVADQKPDCWGICSHVDSAPVC